MITPDQLKEGDAAWWSNGTEVQKGAVGASWKHGIYFVVGGHGRRSFYSRLFPTEQAAVENCIDNLKGLLSLHEKRWQVLERTRQQAIDDAEEKDAQPTDTPCWTVSNTTKDLLALAPHEFHAKLLERITKTCPSQINSTSRPSNRAADEG